MELTIDYDSTVNDVQVQFNTLYPFLKLQFLKLVPEENKDIYKKTKAIPELPVKKLRLMNNCVRISIEKKVTVAELLKNFRDIGLRVQVCRKSASQWVETSLTDDWTLERQNNEAMLLSVPMEKTCCQKCEQGGSKPCLDKL
ncbi:MAG: hypothetical protein ABIN89_04435 [Chitinophagaceae bacterium]